MQAYVLEVVNHKMNSFNNFLQQQILMDEQNLSLIQLGYFQRCEELGIKLNNFYIDISWTPLP